MLHISDLLAAIPLPASESPDPSLPAAAAPKPCDAEIVHDFGADLPAGHLHVWGGPRGAGKTAFLLSLLYGASSGGRRVVYATYDLSPETLALRLLAMAAGVDVDNLPDPGGPVSAGRLTPEGLACALAARESLSALPFSILAARGFSTDSLYDRLVRMPFRPEVLAVDYLQGVVREPGTDPGVALRALSDMAERLHVAVLCAVRAGAAAESPARSAVLPAVDVPDRVGWIAPAATRDAQPGGHGASQAEVIRNRHGAGPAVPLHFDASGGGFLRADQPSM